jgi:hypothetical protein
MFWVCFTPIGNAEIVVLPPGEMPDRPFVVDIILHSLEEKFAQTRDPNPEKGQLLHL